jgi:transcriptional regulator with XRE-family HTH domain
MGYGVTWLSNIERGSRTLTKEQLIELLDVLMGCLTSEKGLALIYTLSQKYIVRPKSTRYKGIDKWSWNLVRIRVELGYSVEEFAAQLGVPYTTLSVWQSNQALPGHRITEICDKLVVLAGHNALVQSFIAQLRDEAPLPKGKPGPKKKKKGGRAKKVDNKENSNES